VVRGGNKTLYSSLTNAEATETDTVTSFNSNGWTMGGNIGINESSSSFVAWAFDAGSSTVTNTQGSITSSVRANATAGFSIVTWTGDGSGSETIGHGLGVAPAFIIVKDRSLSRQWNVYHASLGATKGMVLNSTFDGGNYNDAGYWNNTSPTSTVFTVGTYENEASNYVAYCFAPVVGYSSFGSYTGNGSADGPFVYTGHRSRWVMVKRTDSGSNWTIWDTSRDPYNYAGRSLYPNLSNAEDANTPTGGAQVIDVLSNGFKLRDTGGSGQVNASGGTYIWASFAEHPFQYARAR
jgi:hypothetical protein